MQIAMISYNAFVDGESNGWHCNGKDGVLLAQNVDGRRWGVSQIALTDALARGASEHCASQVSNLWGQLTEALPTLDKVVIYVGSTGAERAIELAAGLGLEPDKAVFIFCDCNLSAKKALINRLNFSSSQVMMCQCGGQTEMRRIYRDFLDGKGLQIS